MASEFIYFEGALSQPGSAGSSVYVMASVWLAREGPGSQVILYLLA